jgi:hypothetical protein
MKYLAFTSEDQGVIFEANNWEDAKVQLKKKLTKDALLREVKMVNLSDGSEKQYVPNIKQSGGKSALYSVAQNMNQSTKQLVEYLQESGEDVALEDPLNKHPACTIM